MRAAGRRHRDTLLAHQSQWVTESTPTRAVLDLLTPAERELYGDLVDGTFGPAIRLEQERISFAALARALDEQPRVPVPIVVPGELSLRYRRSQPPSRESGGYASGVSNGGGPSMTSPVLAAAAW